MKSFIISRQCYLLLNQTYKLILILIINSFAIQSLAQTDSTKNKVTPPEFNPVLEEDALKLKRNNFLRNSNLKVCIKKRLKIAPKCN